MSLLADFARALAQLGDPRFRRVLYRALLVVIAALAAIFWALMLGLGQLLPDVMTLPWIGEVAFVDSLLSWTTLGLMIALSVILMVPATAAAAGFFLDDVAAAVEARHYPALPPARSPGIGEQVWDAARFLALVVAANLGALVVYLLAPPLAPFVFWLVNGFLLGREYFQLVALRRLPPGEAARLRRVHSGRVWLGGVAMALPLSVPFLNLLVPIVGVAVFTHQFHRLSGPATRA